MNPRWEEEANTEKAQRGKITENASKIYFLWVWAHPAVRDSLHPLPSTSSMKSGADTVEITQRPCWEGDKENTSARRAKSLGSSSQATQWLCALCRWRAHPKVQKIHPFGVAMEAGRGAAGVAAEGLLDTVWFREAERAGLYRKAILAGSRMSVETVKQIVLQLLSTETACPWPRFTHTCPKGVSHI